MKGHIVNFLVNMLREHGTLEYETEYTGCCHMLGFTYTWDEPYGSFLYFSIGGHILWSEAL